jgi:GNAT superfamily N-acetyltransferase
MRQAETGDIKALCGLMEALSGRAISPEQMRNRLEFVAESRVDSLFVCEADGRIVGLLGFRLRENLEEMSRYGEISAIVVEPDDRGRGIGRFMMDYAEKLAKEQGCKGTWLVSGFGREQPAHKFYKRLGYQINGRRFVKPFEL